MQGLVQHLGIFLVMMMMMIVSMKEVSVSNLSGCVITNLLFWSQTPHFIDLIKA
jgi:hypothetical protein